MSSSFVVAASRSRRGRPAGIVPGSLFGRYRVLSFLGDASASVVLRAEDTKLQRLVALRVMDELEDEDRWLRDRSILEFELTASLQHPNVLPIDDAGEIDGHVYIATPLVQGVDLGVLLSRGRQGLDRRVLIGIISQAAGALDAAHERGLVHRDIKPQSIFITENQGEHGRLHVYVSDFGFGKYVDTRSRLSSTGELAGSVNYVSPEQITGRSIDRRADIYSLGCVLHECLTGSVPFQRETELSVLWEHVHSDPPRISDSFPGLPKRLDQVLAVAMAKSPKHRYSSCAALANDLDIVFDADSTTVPTAAESLRIANSITDAEEAKDIGRWDEAAGFYDQALQACEQSDLPDALRMRIRRQLGKAKTKRKATPLVSPEAMGAGARPAASFASEGDYWTITFMGKTCRLRDSKGLRYIDELVHNPNRELHPLDLVVRLQAGVSSTADTSDIDGPFCFEGDGGKLLDATAKARFSRRLDDLREELAEAQSFGDKERAARTQEEINSLCEALRSAYGLGGRPRRSNSSAERARVSVTKAIKSALKRITAVDAILGAHLSATVRTGNFCCYVPDPLAEIDWS